MSDVVHYEHWPEATVLCRIRLTAAHVPTGSTRHYDGGGLLPPPAEVVIARHDSSYYIFYLDGAGDEMTDLFEQTLADALMQTEAEFGIKPDEWEFIAEAER
jgi:hypothetical protein